MPKFYGKIGYATTVETAPGATRTAIKELTASGDILRSTLRLADGEIATNDISISNAVSILPSAIVKSHLATLRYVTYLGVRWKIDSIESRPPRIILNLGEVFNGPEAEAD